MGSSKPYKSKLRKLQEEEYMSPKMLAYFKKKLLTWKKKLLVDLDKEELIIHERKLYYNKKDDITLTEVILENKLIPDVINEEDLIYRIDYALSKIEDGTYGYCEITGKAIGIERLKSWPVAITAIEAPLVENIRRY